MKFRASITTTRWSSRLGGLLLALLMLLSLPAAAQKTPTPIPLDKLPPLKLPALPNQAKTPAGDQLPPLPAQQGPNKAKVPPPPPPLPMPKGTPEVKPNIPSGVRYFKLTYDGKLVGYSSFDKEASMGLGGESFIILRSQAKVKLGEGHVGTSSFFGKLLLDKQTLRPSYYKCIQQSDAGTYQVECVYSPSMVAQTNMAGDHKTVHFYNFKADEGAPRLLFNNLWGSLDTFPEHYWLLVRSAVKGGVLPAYDPILRGGGKIIVYPPTHETFDWHGTKVKTLLYPISDMQGTLLAYVRVRASNLGLLEVDEVGDGIKMVRSDAGIVAQVDKAHGLNLLPLQTAESNVIFSDPERLTELDANIELNLRGGQYANHRIPGYLQYFTGVLKQGYMKGRVVVRSVPLDITYTTPFPLQDKIPAKLHSLTRPGPGVESDFPPLQIKARELTWKAPTTFEAARRLMNYVAQIQGGVSLPSARYAFSNGVANSQSRALLLVAMARAVGLPARCIGGLLYRNGRFVPHYWTEVWLGSKETWAPFDPTTQEAGRIGATHIALSRSGDIQSLSLAVTDYAPRTVKTVKFFNHELGWPVGQQRVYSILRNGHKVGQEVAAVTGLVLKGDQQLFRFVAQSQLNDKGKSKQTRGVLLITPKGLPTHFVLSSGDQKETFTFQRDIASFCRSKAKKASMVREIPFARGTYLADQRLLTQWALVVGQAKKPHHSLKPGQRLSLHVFVPEHLKSEGMVLTVKKPVTIKTKPGHHLTLQRLESDAGWTFLLNHSGQVVRISIPAQKLELVLEKTHFKLN